MFPLIRDYLCGYMVLPLSDSAIPKGMTPTQLITNLRADALFYQLEGLVRQCDEYLEPVKRGLPASHRYLLVGWKVSKYGSAGMFSSTKGVPKRTITPKDLGWHLYVTRPELEKPRVGLRSLMAREDFMGEGALGLRALTTLASRVDRILPLDGRRRWVVDAPIDEYSYDEGGKEGDEDEEEVESGEEDQSGSNNEDSEEEDSGEDSTKSPIPDSRATMAK
ncbi:hypothetical protein RSAG8_12568, partial [Rhizoctonia solani AG-8 WAC10335]